MDNFEQDFMHKVQGTPVEGEVVNPSAHPIKTIDKRWFLLIGLIVILIITVITLLIIDNANNSASPTTPPPSLASSTWTCSDNSTLTFDDSENLTWSDPIGTINAEYTISSSELSFGNVTGIIDGNTLTLTTSDSQKITCHKENA
jgi:hypothetical protein